MNDDAHKALQDEIEALKALVDAQVEDEALWFLDGNCAETYLQMALRKLHHNLECFFQVWLEEE